MKKVKGKILIIDDDPDVLHTARFVLKTQFTDIITESDPNQINYLLNHERFDVILLDMNYTIGETSGREGLNWLEHILQINPAQNVVMITAYGDIKLAVETMKVGAADFVVKPWENEKLIATVYAAFNHSQSKKEVERLRSKQEHLSKAYATPETEIIGNSSAMKEVFATVKKVARTDANVLILGENGTGKELIAKALHQASQRNHEAFIKVDLGAISETLFESELFGHVKGAFTDAKEDRLGRFEIASGGTLFLDEIGNLSMQLQAKLLTVTQNREVFKVGSNVPVPIDIRLICATNMPLYELVVEKKFREDLLYRFNTVEIRLPPLRERPEDIPLLSEYFLDIYAAKYRKRNLKLSNTAMNYLQKYFWPGNVRELQHAIERAVIMSEEDELKKTDFLLNDKKHVPSQEKNYNLDEVERETIKEAIERHAGNMSRAAKELGLGRTTLYRKIQKYGL
ncbi:sigma-54 dependent transcriptional regulator [Fulvivirgaceae bacterium BMA10]|uniref:Sigma-54 dependent transcriptional regulator n=1 Tax=Splendidivirga corallicola TaxID=3051826 RepID=A0ABT8KX08_9BACT|nr:sigma-54 dependent transcriptional regulator [Fulvivirgaceae bacterium BMA10]